MTAKQIQDAIASVKVVLEIVAKDEGWREVFDADDRQGTNLNDAIHYLEEILCNFPADSKG